MRIRLGVFVGCMLFLAYGSRAEDGKGNQSVPASGTSASNASDTHRMDDAALLPVVSEVCGYRSPDEWRAAFQTAVERGEIPDPALTSPPAVAPRANRAGGGACAPVPQTSDIFLFEDSAGTLLTNFSEGQLDSLMTSAANALLVAEGDNFDFIGFWVSFVPHHQIGAAFYRGIENNVAGIGLPIFNDRPFIGLAGDNVEGYIMMWNINDGLWAPGTAGNFASFTRLVLAQEIEHRWGVFLPNLLDGRSMQGNNVCGRFFHWNWQIDGQGSGMEIREWIGSSPAVLGGSCVNGAPDLCFNSDTGGVFSYTDLYLMGFVSPAEMDAGNSELRYMDAGCNSPYNGSISTFSSADIVASAGTRNPSSAASQHDYHIGWIMFHQPGDPPNATELDKAVGILAQQSIDWEFSTIGVGTLNNTLQSDCTFTVKFSQRPTPGGENIASNIDWTDDDPNVVVADDFVSDGRPINSLRWWGSDLVLVTGGDEPTDDCNAPSSVNEGTFSFSNLGADTDGPAGACAAKGADVWIDYVPTCTGTATIDTCGSNFDTVLEAFDGCSCDPLGTLLGCNDDDSGECGGTLQSSLSFPVTAGQCIKVRISGFGGAEGTGTLHIGCTVCSEPGSCEMGNGGFEDGEFCNWTATTNGLGEFFSWTIGAAGTSTGFHGSSPIEGLLDAINGFDGDAGLVYELFQDVALPAAATITLTTNHRIQYDSLGIPSALPRELDISIRDTGNTILAPLFHQDVLVDGAPNTDLGWNTQVFDISAFAGQTIRIHFEEFIAEGFTGPAMIEFDDITLACTVAASNSSASDGAGSVETTRVITLESPTPRGAVAFEELRERYLGMRENALAAANSPWEAAPPTTRRLTAEDLAKYGQTAPRQYGLVANAMVSTDSGFGPDGFTGTVDQDVLSAPGTIATTGFARLTGNLGGVVPGALVDFEGFGIATGGAGQMFSSDPQGANLVTVDPATGLFTVIGPFVGAAGPITEIEWSPDGSTLYATTGGGGATLHTVDPTTGTILTSVVHDFGALNGLEFDAAGNLLGTLIGGPGTPSELVMVNTNTGILTVIGLTGFNAIGGLAFDAGFTTLFGITSGGAAIPPTLLNVNPATGLATPIAPVSVATEMSSLEFTSSGQLVAGGADGILYDIDTTTGVATAVGPLVNAGKVSGLSVKAGS
ncbi:MAG: hypothetical protein IID42_03010, partial [Planctomycetes bacterium]|nr:hypothetical protein [Planctomycetota bacterium]